MFNSFDLFSENEVDWIKPQSTRKKRIAVSVGKPTTDFRRYISFNGSLKESFPDSRIEIGIHTKLKRLCFRPTASHAGYKIQRNSSGDRFKISIPLDAIDLAPFEGNHKELYKITDKNKTTYYIEYAQKEDTNG